MLTVEPTRAEILDLKYDHATQTSTFGDHVSGQLKARYTYVNTSTFNVNSNEAPPQTDEACFRVDGWKHSSSV
jgi:hypothetical protein